MKQRRFGARCSDGRLIGSAEADAAFRAYADDMLTFFDEQFGLFARPKVHHDGASM
jgi:hypothetical protein